ncbi:MAG: hypothetical protein FWG45_01835 [Oscillospiraceae bacterium]|nr:hypothetical protein [Oscillospiraceae bacterium]
MSKSKAAKARMKTQARQKKINMLITIAVCAVVAAALTALVVVFVDWGELLAPSTTTHSADGACCP